MDRTRTYPCLCSIILSYQPPVQKQRTCWLNFNKLTKRY